MAKDKKLAKDIEAVEEKVNQGIVEPKDPNATSEQIVASPAHKVQAGIQSEVGILHPSTGEILNQDLGGKNNIHAPQA